MNLGFVLASDVVRKLDKGREMEMLEFFCLCDRMVRG